MDINEFREFGRAAIDFLADYFENIRERLECRSDWLLMANVK